MKFLLSISHSTELSEQLLCYEQVNMFSSYICNGITFKFGVEIWRSEVEIKSSDIDLEQARIQYFKIDSY